MQLRLTIYPAVAFLGLLLINVPITTAEDTLSKNDISLNFTQKLENRITIDYDGPYGVLEDTNFFSDCILGFQDYGSIVEVNIYYDYVVHGMQMKYGSTEGPLNGGSTGDLRTISLQPGENIVSAFGRLRRIVGRHLVSLGFRTNMGNTYGPYGNEAGEDYVNFNAEAPLGKRLVCIDGNNFNYYGNTAIGSIVFGWGA